MTMPNAYDLFIKRWAWLFPVTYIFHMVEEYGWDFSCWMANHITGKDVELRFFILDLCFFTGMIVGVAVATRFPVWRWLGIALAVSVITNPVLHLIGTAAYGYSPGAITGSLFWLPLGGYTLLLAYRHVETLRFAIGIIIGIIASVIINGAFLTVHRFTI